MSDAVDHHAIPTQSCDHGDAVESCRGLTPAYLVLLSAWLIAGVLVIFGVVERLLTGGGEWSLLTSAVIWAVGAIIAGRLLGREQARLIDDAVRQLADTGAAVRREAEIAAVQESVLAEVRGCGRLTSALMALFRRLVPSARDGFACYLEFRHDGVRIRAVRGVSLVTGRDVPFDSTLRRRLTKRDFVKVTADELRKTEFAAALPRDARRKIRSVYLIRVGDAELPAGVIVTTRLFSAASDSNTLRVLRECCDHLQQLITRHDSKAEVDSQSVLRGLIQPAETEPGAVSTRPAGGIVLTGLRDVVPVDRVSAFVFDKKQDSPAPLFRSGVPVVPTIDRVWSRHEATLLNHAEQGRFVYLSPPMLKQLGIDSIISSAAVATFAVNGSQTGALVVTNRSRWQPSPRDERLIVGCCEFLGDDRASDVAEPDMPSDALSTETTVDDAAAISPQPELKSPEAVSAREEFLAVMSHELRTPVSTILGMTELALSGNLPAEQRQYLSLVQSSSESMLTMLNDILDLAKLEAGALQPERIEFPLHATLGEALKSIAFKAHEKKLELCLGIARDVPDVLVGDPVRLRQVLINLVANAVKFTRSGEVAVRVEAAGAAAEGHCRLRFAVRDSGCGIPPDVQDRIFSKYAQADEAVSRTYGGTGLGLAISREIVEMLGGTIAVDSQPEKGSTFHFELEFPIGTREAPGATERRIPLAGSVLIVDDHPVTRGDLAEAVESLGLSCRLAASADEAARFLSDVAAILLDADLPAASDLLTRIEEIPEGHRPAVILLRPVVLGSGTVSDDHAAVCHSLFKPVHRDEIRVALLVERQLPMCGLKPEAQAKDFPSCPSLALQASIQPFRVLLADDNLVNHFVTSQVLEHRGLEVTAVADGREAVEMTLREPFDLVLMDMQMPELDGLAATAEIRRRERDNGRRTPIVAMTAFSRREDRARCEQAGMDSFLTKPLTLKMLDACLHDLHARGLLKSTPQCDGRAMIGESDTFDEVADLFRATCAETMHAIIRAASEGNAAALESSVHSLKGAASCLGEDGLVELLAELERLAADCRLDNVLPLVQRLDAEIARVLR